MFTMNCYMSGYNNIVSLISKREKFGNRCNRHLLQTYFSSRSYTLNHIKRNAGVVECDGYLYLKSFTLQLCMCLRNGTVHLTETKINTSNSRKLKVKDSLTYISPYTSPNDREGLNNGTYTHCIFVLTDQSLLRRYKFNYVSGEWLLTKEFKFLSHYKFQSFVHGREDDVFVIKSKKHCLHSRNRTGETIFYFALFKIAPFQFICLFRISSELFIGLRDVNVFDGFLVISSQKLLKFYSLEDVIGIDYSLVTDKVQESVLRENIFVTQVPACLLSLPTSDVCSMSIGGFPWSCVIQRNEQVFKLYRLPKLNEIDSVSMDREDGFDRRGCSFHGDGSNRLVCLDLNNIRVLNLNEHEPYLTEAFRLSFVSPVPSNDNIVTSSGRQVKRYKDPTAVDLLSDVIHSFAYNTEIDVIGVVYTKIESPSSFMVGVFSSKDGRLMKNFPIDDLKISDCYEWEMVFDDLMIILILKHIIQKSQTTCFFYLLS